jgi:23S rRNA maturation-related 3'-5' exoribonuclease YhaM
MFHLPNPYYFTASIHSSNNYALREAGNVEDSLGDFETNTLERLRDGQVKLAAARYEHYAGSQKHMVNQMRTATVSRHTSLNVLEIRKEHLWVYSVCKDYNFSTNH